MRRIWKTKKISHLCNPKRGKRLTKGGSAGAGKKKSKKKFCGFKKSSYLCRPKRKTEEGRKIFLPDFWKTASGMLNFAGPDGGRGIRKKIKNKKRVFCPGERKKAYLCIPPRKRGHIRQETAAVGAQGAGKFFEVL